MIERFGKGGGDPYLGGENILSLMAYELYKDNITAMRAKKIPLVLPPKAQRFAGSENLVMEMRDASQQAQMNVKVLAELLRPIWERHAGYEESISNAGTREIKLFTSAIEGDKEFVNVNVTIDIEHMEACIKRTIRAGVEDFFTEMMHAFEQLEALPIHIFLAGNSCKSPVVHRIFRELIEIYGQRIVEELEVNGVPSEGIKDNLFVLHLPLGVEESGDNQTDNPQGERLDLDQVRTGKTGVVFGLLRSRKGGRDVKIIDRDIAAQDEIIFPYYMGDINRDGHFHVRIGREIVYGQWVPFIAADEDEFELYYTKEARALSAGR